MRVVVTGASGFIGLHLVRALLEGGHEVTAVVRAVSKVGPFAQQPRLCATQADLDAHTHAAGVMRGQEAWVHAALLWGEPGTERRDVEATSSLCEAAGRAGVSRCVLLSSAAVHRPFSARMTETDQLQPVEPYGVTKLAGERALHDACSRFGMTGVALRPGPVVGPPAFPGGSWRSPAQVEAFAREALAGRPITVVEGEGRQLCGVSTLVTAVTALLQAEKPHPAYLCMDPEPITWEHVARTVVRAFQSTSAVEVVPREDPQPVPRFSTALIEGLLGGPSNAEAELAAHVRELRGR
jgi:nucleoside-diphosphate-sugar epimerase